MTERPRRSTHHVAWRGQKKEEMERERRCEGSVSPTSLPYPYLVYLTLPNRTIVICDPHAAALGTWLSLGA